MDNRIKQIIHENASRIRELAQKFNSYYSGDITAQKIVAFLLQFEDYEKIKHVLKLLFNINFLSSRKITHLIKSAYEKISEQDKSQPLIAPLGTSQDSSALVCYSLFKDIFEDESDTLDSVIEVTQIENTLANKNPSSIIFIDDNITSGTQLKDFFEELLVGTEKPELIRIPLSKESSDKLKNIPIYVCYAIRLTKECQDKIDEIKSTYNLNLQVFAGADDYYNYTEFSSPIIDSPEESKRIKDLVIEYSKPLYQDKNWDREKLYNRLIGYGNLGKLTVFNHNVPKSFIPFFWKTGIVNGRAWIPLFPERQELKEIEQNKYAFNIYLCEVANNLLNDINITRKPEIEFYFQPLNGTKDKNGNLILDIPNNESLSEVFKSLRQDTHPHEPNKYYIPGGSTTPFTGQTSPRKKSLSNEKYGKYKKYIDDVNLGQRSYEKNFELYLTKLSGQGKLNIVINNHGIGEANNVRFRLYYNSSDLIIGKPTILVAPRKHRYKVGKVRNFHSRDHSFKEEDLFEPFHYYQEVSGKNIAKNMELSFSQDYPKISHKDSKQRTIPYIIMNRDKDHFILAYELLWDESIEGIKGAIKIFINKVSQSKKELSYFYDQIAKS